MIPTHPNYPKRFINEVTFMKDGLWFYLDQYRSATNEQRKIWIQDYQENKPYYTDESLKKMKVFGPTMKIYLKKNLTTKKFGIKIN